MNQQPDKKALAVLGVAVVLLLAYVAMGVMEGRAEAAVDEVPVMDASEPTFPEPPRVVGATEKQLGRLLEFSQESQRDAVSDEVYAEDEYLYQNWDSEVYSGSQTGYSGGSGYYVDENGVVHAEYNELYNSDGPSREMPGWHDGYLETYYNASAHKYAGSWTLDDEGFYHDSEGRYVVGVDINHKEDMPYGTVVQTGKGEGVVYDYGAGWEVHDFATIW